MTREVVLLAVLLLLAAPRLAAGDPIDDATAALEEGRACDAQQILDQARDWGYQDAALSERALSECAAAQAAARESERARGRDAERDRGSTDAAETSGGAGRSADDLIRDARRAGIRGDHSEAIALLEEAKDLAPREGVVYLMLYTNYSRVGDDRRAARSLQRYIELAPNDHNVPQYRQILEQLEGN